MGARSEMGFQKTTPEAWRSGDIVFKPVTDKSNRRPISCRAVFALPPWRGSLGWEVAVNSSLNSNFYGVHSDGQI